MEKRPELKVDEEKGHDEDIVVCVHHKLRITDKEIKKELLRKAAHVFMWVVLVIEMLNQAFDEGEVRAMRRKLREVPSDLDEVFSALINKENSNKQNTILILQWVLFAKKLLKPEELYFAVLAGTAIEELGAWNRSNETPEVIKRFITSTSRGLIEVRNGDEETVQFIHESVNDFLMRNKRLQTLDPALEPHAIGASHGRLAACCMSYIMIQELEPSADDISYTEKGLAFNYPFLEYASFYVLKHAEMAQAGCCSQKVLVHRLQYWHRMFDRLKTFHDVFTKLDFEEYSPNIDLLYAMSLEGCSELVQIALFEEKADVNAQGGYYGNALQAASVAGQETIVQQLLEKGANVNAQGGHYGNVLQAASVRGQEAIVQLLLKKRVDVNTQGGYYANALQAASVVGQETIVQQLLKKGADVNAQGGTYGNALHAASVRGQEAIVQLLLEKGANVNAQDGYYGNALQAASVEGKEAIVQQLLEKGANINAQGGYYGNVLQAASAKGQETIVQQLLKKGANVNAQGGYYSNALQAASVKGHKAIVQLLLEKGADVNTQDGHYGNALQAALVKGQEAILQLLLKKGADTNAQDGYYGNALQAASVEGHETIVQLLLEKGANVNAQGGLYGNALQAASANGQETIVQWLLKAGAVPLSQAYNTSQNRPIETATLRKRNRSESEEDL